MAYKSIKLPEEFLQEVKFYADKEYRPLPQQIQHWVELGRQKEVRSWQVEQMEIGLEQIKNGKVINNEEVMDRLKKYRQS
jgi:predicted transcriptional regulator